MAERVILEDKLKLFQDVGAGFSVFIASPSGILCSTVSRYIRLRRPELYQNLERFVGFAWDRRQLHLPCVSLQTHNLTRLVQIPHV